MSEIQEAGQGDRIVALAQEAARIADALRKIASILEEMIDAGTEPAEPTDTDRERRQDYAELS